MTVETRSTKLMIASTDLNAKATRTTINYVNPEKFTASAMESDETLIPALAAMFGLSSNTMGDVQFSQTFDLYE